MGININSNNCNNIIVNGNACNKITINGITVYEKVQQYYEWNADEFATQLITNFKATPTTDGGYTYTASECNGKHLLEGKVFKENTQYEIILFGRCTNTNSTATNMKIVYKDGSVGYTNSFAEKGQNSYMRMVTPKNKTIDYLIGYYSTYGNVIYPELCSITEITD